MGLVITLRVGEIIQIGEVTMTFMGRSDRGSNPKVHFEGGRTTEIKRIGRREVKNGKIVRTEY